MVLYHGIHCPTCFDLTKPFSGEIYVSLSLGVSDSAVEYLEFTDTFNTVSCMSYCCCCLCLLDLKILLVCIYICV